MFAVPVAAPPLAVKMSDAPALGLTVNGEAGLSITPAGNVLNETCTCPENPF